MYNNSLQDCNGISAFIDGQKALFFFPEASVSVADGLIVVVGKGFQNSFRFIDMSELEKLGQTNAIDLVCEWAKRGYLGAGSVLDAMPSDLGGAAYSEGITTDIDLKQTKDNLPLFYSRVSNGTASQTHVLANAATAMAVTANGDYAIAQTFQRFNYQTGKTKFVQITFVNLAQEVGVIKRVGYFNGGNVAPYDNFDGIFIESTETDFFLCVAKNGVVNRLPMAQWSDKLDGLGTSGVTADFSKAQILRIEYLWLGFGGVKFSLLIDGLVIPIGFIPSANIDESIYMRSPNQPVRYEIRSVGGAGTLEQVCATVGQYGGSDQLGVVRSVVTGTTSQAFQSAGTTYMMIGLRLKATHQDVKIGVLEHQVLCTSNDDYLYQIILNPTISGTVTWEGEVNSSIERAIGLSGAAANVVTGGIVLHSGIGKQNTVQSNALENALRLGANIEGQSDILVLAFTPLSAGASAYAIINLLESN